MAPPPPVWPVNRRDWLRVTLLCEWKWNWIQWRRPLISWLHVGRLASGAQSRASRLSATRPTWPPQSGPNIMGPGESRCYRLIELSQQKLAARAPDARHQAAGWPGESSRVESSRVESNGRPHTHSLSWPARPPYVAAGNELAILTQCCGRKLSPSAGRTNTLTAGLRAASEMGRVYIKSRLLLLALLTFIDVIGAGRSELKRELIRQKASGSLSCLLDKLGRRLGHQNQTRAPRASGQVNKRWERPTWRLISARRLGSVGRKCFEPAGDGRSQGAAWLRPLRRRQLRLREQTSSAANLMKC